MKKLTFVGSIIFLGAILPFGLGAEELEPGGRHGLHGMVLFGAGPHFLSHIPMNHPPHDFQIVAEVELQTQSGQPIAGDFSNQSFTLKPESTFSLNDYVNKDLQVFSGSIHHGSFEMGAPILPGLESVVIKVKAFKLVRQIPNSSDLSFLKLSDESHSFKINIITPQSSVQKIENVDSGKSLWCVVGPDFFRPCP